jgi:hypothetical protein
MHFRRFMTRVKEVPLGLKKSRKIKGALKAEKVL